MKVYHIDRTNLLAPNKIIDLDKTIKIDPNILQKYLSDNYSEGLSRHGIQYLANPSNQQNAGSSIYEALFEYERRLSYPNANSRYQSFFGLKTLNDVKIWLDYFTGNKIQQQKKIQVWEIDTLDSTVQEYDSSFLGGGNLNNLASFSLIATQYNAEKYWSGESSDNPRKELLISPKIKILRRIRFTEIPQ